MRRESAEQDRKRNVAMMHYSGDLKGSLGAELVQQLLPGIPDHITIDIVAPKLPWTALCELSRVSCGWQRAIQSRQVYDARVRSQSTQTLVVMNHNLGNDVNAPALYSLSDNSFCHLPPFSSLGINHGKLPRGCQCISLDGKLYVLGGKLHMIAKEGMPWYQASAAVYVLDVAGHGKWTQCASMQDPRPAFACGVMNGKIYVFGGRRARISKFCYGIGTGCEVYDPKSDAWSPIAPTRYVGVHQNVVTTIGEELFMYAGEDHYKRLHDSNNPTRGTRTAEVYHPLRNQWRTLDHFTNVYGKLLLAGGKCLRLSMRDCIDIYDISSNSWKPSQRLSVGTVARMVVPTGHHQFDTDELCAAVAVDDELLALVRWTRFELHANAIRSPEKGIWLLRSHGLGSQDKGIVWEKMQSMAYNHFPSLCTIQL